MKFPSAANDNLINRTIGLWQARGGRTLSHEDARQIVENVTGFFSILHEWSRTENPRAGNDSRERLAAVRHGAPRLSTSEAGPKRGRRLRANDTLGSAIP